MRAEIAKVYKGEVWVVVSPYLSSLSFGANIDHRITIYDRTHMREK